MSSTIQNRLVGTIILVALAVIFLPDLLSGKVQNQQDKFVKGPQRPALKPIVEPRNVSMQEIESKASKPSSDQQNFKVEQTQDAPQPPESTNDVPPETTDSNADNTTQQQAQPIVVDQSLQQDTVVERPAPAEVQNTGWVVQLGAFSREKNVRELLDKLQAAGYRAYSQTAKTGSSKLIKVFVGPEIDKQKMQKAIPHLKTITKLQGKLVQFSGQ